LSDLGDNTLVGLHCFANDKWRISEAVKQLNAYRDSRLAAPAGWPYLQNSLLNGEVISSYKIDYRRFSYGLKIAVSD
jgi:hypothetical protein